MAHLTMLLSLTLWEVMGGFIIICFYIQTQPILHFKTLAITKYSYFPTNHNLRKSI